MEIIAKEFIREQLRISSFVGAWVPVFIVVWPCAHMRARASKHADLRQRGQDGTEVLEKL